MSGIALQGASVERLVQMFVNVAVAQAAAIDEDDHRRYNRLVDDHLAIEKELRSRPGDQRRALRPLLDDIRPQVRMNAALATLAVLPTEAGETLRLIHARREYPQAADALGVIESIERGTYVPE